MPGFRKLFRLDITAYSGSLLVYVKRSIPTRQIQAYKLPFDLQGITVRKKLGKGKVVVY